MWPYKCTYDVPLMTLMEPIRCYSQGVCMPKFRPVAPFFFLATVPFFFLCFFWGGGGGGNKKGVWPYRYAFDVPLVTLIPNIYIYI